MHVVDTVIAHDVVPARELFPWRTITARLRINRGNSAEPHTTPHFIRDRAFRINADTSHRAKGSPSCKYQSGAR